MSKSVKKFMPGDLWDFGKNESWFSDMALKGLHLQSIGSWFAVFEKGQPQKTKYRIEVLEESPLRSSLNYTGNGAGIWLQTNRCSMFFPHLKN